MEKSLLLYLFILCAYQNHNPCLQYMFQPDMDIRLTVYSFWIYPILKIFYHLLFFILSMTQWGMSRNWLISFASSPSCLYSCLFQSRLYSVQQALAELLLWHLFVTPPSNINKDSFHPKLCSIFTSESYPKSYDFSSKLVMLQWVYVECE